MLWVNQVIKQLHCPRNKAVTTALARAAIQDSSSVPSVERTLVKEGLSNKRKKVHYHNSSMKLILWSAVRATVVLKLYN